MKFVNPSVEYWEQAPGLSGVWSQIAKATRVCYQSKQRKDETDEEFVKRVILDPAMTAKAVAPHDVYTGEDLYDFNKMHGAMLEHGAVYLIIPNVFDEETYYEIVDNTYSRVKIRFNNAYITTNMRYILEHNKSKDLLNFLVEPTEHHIKRYTFSVITDISVTREMNRHRTFSVAEQSTRYCDFNKDKFGGELTFIRPAWWENKSVITSNDNIATREYDLFCQRVEEIYKTLRKLGWKPEQARQVLPLGLKTQAVYTAFEDDWKHFLKLRADNVSGKVHPNMAVVANMIKDKFKEITNN